VELENSLGRNGAWVAAGAILTGMLMAAWATARVTRPVRRLAESAGQVAAGNWNTTVEVTSHDEVGQLAQAFNRMTHELVEQRQRLLQTERVAAWRELARRLAHELKNPLFPLQITVENMQRARESHPAEFDEEMCIRDSSRITLLARHEDRWEQRQTVRLTPPGPWPRDLRGRLRLSAPRFEALLPGLACQGAIEPELSLDCRPGDQPWMLASGSRAPLAANFAPGRNYFDGRVVTQTGAARSAPPFLSLIHI